MQAKNAIREWRSITLSYQASDVGKRWYQELSGRFEEYIELALASNDARRRNLAWILMDEYGAERGTAERFIQATGFGQGRISLYLRGQRGIPAKAMHELAAILDRPLDDFQRIEHPLGFSARGPHGAIEPGDVEWESQWLADRAKAISKGDPDLIAEFPPIEELKREKPYYFPEEPDQA